MRRIQLSLLDFYIQIYFDTCYQSAHCSLIRSEQFCSSVCLIRICQAEISMAVKWAGTSQVRGPFFILSVVFMLQKIILTINDFFLNTNKSANHAFCSFSVICHACWFKCSKGIPTAAWHRNTKVMSLQVFCLWLLTTGLRFFNNKGISKRTSWWMRFSLQK